MIHFVLIKGNYTVEMNVNTIFAFGYTYHADWGFIFIEPTIFAH